MITMHNCEWMHVLQRRERVLRRAASVMAMASLASCNSTPPQAEDPRSHVAPVPQIAAGRTEGAIYGAGHGLVLFEDNKARHPGDLLTIELQESTSASKTAKTSASKNQQTEVDLGRLEALSTRGRDGATTAPRLHGDQSVAIDAQDLARDPAGLFRTQPRDDG